MKYSRRILVLLCCFFVSHVSSGSPPESPRYVPNRLLVRVDQSKSKAADLALFRLGAQVVRQYETVQGLVLVKFPSTIDIGRARQQLLTSSSIEYAEPDYLYQASFVPNDPDFAKLWAMNNLGQEGGVPDADINAPEMWEHAKGSKDLVIGVIDTGIFYTHPDLADNIWINTREIPGNGIDDDNNGYVDDIHGINAIKKSGDPLDDHGHGTHVSGTIGARGDNGIGVAGVNHIASIAGCKFLDRNGSGSSSDAITCLNYFAQLADSGVPIVATNNSWGGGPYSQALADAIKANEDRGILFVAAAGNDTRDNDSAEAYPANYPFSNVISVAAVSNKDEIASFSNYGQHSVHVAAPGVNILSTVLNNKYASYSGTSMAAPHVTGLIGLVKSIRPDLDFRQLKNLIIASGQKNASTQAKTLSGRRLRGFSLDGTGALTCVNQEVTARLSPKKSEILLVGQSIPIEVMHINCEQPAQTPSVTINGVSFDLNDNQQNGDHMAADGVFSGLWQPSEGGNYDLDFGGGDVLRMRVFNPASWQTYDMQVAEEMQWREFTGTNLGLGDETAAPVRAPFPIHFAGDDAGFETLYVGSNGAMSFMDPKVVGWQNYALPYGNAMHLIMPFWDDLNATRSAKGVFYEVVKQAPHRELVVEWRDVPRFSGGKGYTFQVVLFEDSPDVLFNYKDVESGNPDGAKGAAAVVGVQVTPQNYTQFSFHEPKLRNGMSIRFVPKR